MSEFDAWKMIAKMLIRLKVWLDIVSSYGDVGLDFGKSVSSYQLPSYGGLFVLFCFTVGDHS